MNYTKTALSITDQIALLKSRKLKIGNEQHAIYNLANISYYRLSAYLLSFQKYNDPNHNYMPWATFEKVVKLYVFDRELRLICLDAIERIEVALRCQISHEYSSRYGTNWYEDVNLYTSPTAHKKAVEKIKDELKNSKEIFIQHYKNKYTAPVNPPSWMTIEVLSFGQISRVYKELKSNDAKKAVADFFGVSPTILESWIESLAYIRNICAHHSRLWNRILTITPIIPKRPKHNWISILPAKTDKIYLSICIMQYLLERCCNNPPFKGKLNSLFARNPDCNLKAAGFPSGWNKDIFWSSKYAPITHKARVAYFRVRNIFSSKSRTV